MLEEFTRLFAARKGHFELESGHHGDLWLDLESLCLHPGQVRPLASALAQQLSRLEIEVVCGPLNEGAFVALQVAEELKMEFTYAERFAPANNDKFYPVQYRLPAGLRERVRGRRTAIVNDVINAGSAVRGTLMDLVECGAKVVVIGTLLLLGDSFARFADDYNIPLITLATMPNKLWTPANCPLCAAGVPIEKNGG